MRESVLNDVVPEWLQKAAVHQDYAWFLGLVVWGLLWLAWWRHPQRGERWGWIPSVGAVAVGTVAVQFVIFDPTFDWFQDRLVPGTTNVYAPAVIAVEWLGDYLLTAGWAAVAAWWWWRGATARAVRGWRWLGLPLAAGAAGWEYASPAGGTVALALVVAGGAAWWWTSFPQGRSRWGLAGGVALMVGSTVGPVAAMVGGLQRVAAATPWGLFAALLQVALGAFLLVVVGRETLSAGPVDAEERERRRREWRKLAFIASVWAVLGVGFAHRVGLDNRNELQRNRLRSVAAEAMVFRTELLEPLVGEQLRLERAELSPTEREPRVLRAEVLASPAAHALRRELSRIVMETPFLDSARILVDRDGLLIALASSRLPEVPDRVEVVREMTAADEAAFAAAAPYIERDIVGEIDDHYFCRAPIVTRDGRVLGWLDYVRREFFQSLERKWRVGPLAVVALGLIGGFMVVLQRRSVRAQERAWRKAAAESEANRLKSTFIAKVSHELRTPLQSLLGYSELLERGAVDAAQRERLGRLREHGDLLLRIVNDLLDLTAMEAGRLQLMPAPVELDRLVEGVVEGLRPGAEAKGLAVACEVAADLRGEWFETDAARVRQLVYNLVGNAVKYTVRGRVQVRLRRIDKGGGNEARLRLEVLDTGPGVKPAERDVLFAPFSRLEETAGQEGTGLGLAMVAALARLMEGGAGAESDGLSGSTFWVEWRSRAVAAPAYEREKAGAGLTASLAGRRVLVAEDNALVRELFLSVLSEQGATCESVADGESALQTALARRFDAMVLDVGLPGISGIEVARRLRSPGVAPGRLRMVGVSAHAGQQDAAQALAAGMDVFLSKPVSLAALCAALAGEADPPRDSGTPFAPSGTRSQQRLVELFRADAENQWQAVHEAVQSGDAVRIKRTTHFLANSAIVVDDLELMERCRELERAASAPVLDSPVIRQAWAKVDQAMRAWRNHGE